MRHLLAPLAPLAIATALVTATVPARADTATDMSAISLLPVASVVLGASAMGAAVAAVPPALSAAGTLVVRGVEASGRGTAIVLERVSDGARVSLELTGRASLAVGSVVTVTVLASGTVLSVAGEVLAFVPNAVGRALLHNEVVAR